MNIFLWVLQILAGLLFLMVGIMKAAQTKEKLREGAAWVEDFSATQVRLIGLAELLGGLGLILPGLTGILPNLTQIAPASLAVQMILAAYTNWRLKEYKQIAVPVVFLLLVVMIAIGRLWGAPL